MNDIVVGALGKGAVDITERLQAVLCHTAREGHSMALGDAHVEDTVGHGLHHDVHRTARGHGWGDAYNLRILLSELQEGLAEDVLKLWWAVAVVVDDALTRSGVEATGACHTVAFFSAGS